MENPKQNDEIAENTKALLSLLSALLEVDKQVIWEMYESNSWKNPDADVCKMIADIKGFIDDNKDLIDVGK